MIMTALDSSIISSPIFMISIILVKLKLKVNNLIYENGSFTKITVKTVKKASIQNQALLKKVENIFRLISFILVWNHVQIVNLQIKVKCLKLILETFVKAENYHSLKLTNQKLNYKINYQIIILVKFRHIRNIF